MPDTTTIAELTPDALTAAWASVSESLHEEIGPQSYTTWFSMCVPTGLEEGVMTLAAPNSFTKRWIEENYSSNLDRLVKAAITSAKLIVVEVDQEACTAAYVEDQDKGPANKEDGDSARPTPQDRPRGSLLATSDFVLNPNYTFESFVVGHCNRFGSALATGAAEQPGTTYNPLFLYGSVGVGKTHLLQGLCHRILEKNPKSRILYVSCETFVNHFVGALEQRTLPSFRDKYRTVDVLVVDDIHILANKDRTQDEFFHTFNHLYNEQKQIVLSSDAPPKEIPTLHDRLVSRFQWGIVAEIEPPYYETRMAIIKRRTRERGKPFPDDVVQWIAERVQDNVRELEGAVARLIAFSEMTKRPIRLDLAHEALGSFLQLAPGAPSVDGIIGAITKQYDVKLSDLQGKRRTKSIIWPRQLAMFLFRVLLPWSLEEIGAYFGGRDHSTVLHAVKKVRIRAREEEGVQKELSTLLTLLGGGPLDQHLLEGNPKKGS